MAAHTCPSEAAPKSTFMTRRMMRESEGEEEEEDEEGEGGGFAPRAVTLNVATV